MRTNWSTASRAVVLFAVAVLMSGAGVVPSHAQPVLSTLWPNGDGTKWTYDFVGWDKGFDGQLTTVWDGEATLTLAGTTTTPGGPAQNLVGWHTDANSKSGPRMSALYRNLWRARPDLRTAIEARAAKEAQNATSAPSWVPLLLHDGFFMKLTDRIEMWQELSNHSTWTLLTDNLSVGHEFTHQLVPELADDVFLHGTVSSNDAVIVTPAGTFSNAVKMSYEIDYGVSDMTDDMGTFVGKMTAVTNGHVSYVPGVGPVDMLEEFIPFASIDCNPQECPQEYLDRVGEVALHLTMSLQAGPVAVEERPWSYVKKLYQ